MSRWPRTSWSRRLRSTICVTGDAQTGRLLGAQLIGMHGAEIAKRVDTWATVVPSDDRHRNIRTRPRLHPRFGAPWDGIQIATQTWVTEHHLDVERSTLSRPH
jgi:hypothetical protein